MVLPCSDRVSRAPPYSKINKLSTRTRLSLSQVSLSILFRFLFVHRLACPISLATTLGVSFDFLSSRYLDVSVPMVRFNNLCIQLLILIAQWVPPFRYLRIKDCSHLPATFRRVPRLSSPLIAKASTRCPFLSWFSLCVCKILSILHTVYQLLLPDIPSCSYIFLNSFFYSISASHFIFL